MESDLQHQPHFFHDHQHQQHHQKQMNSGLTRYQSAPSSCFSSFLDRDFCEDLLNRPTSPETERIFAKLLGNSGGDNTDNTPNQSFAPIKQDSPVREEIGQVNPQAQVMASVNSNDTRLSQQQQQSNYPSVSQNFYQNQSKPPLPNQNPSSGIDYRMVASMGMDRLPQMKTGGNSSNLVRHSSSPAGLFSNITIDMENGYAVMRGMGDFDTGTRETSFSAASRPTPSSGRMSPICEIGNKNLGENSSDKGSFGETRSNNYVTGFHVGSWDDSSAMSAAAAKRLADDDRTLSGLNASETQNRDLGNTPPMLAHHLSLPKTAAELSAVEKFLQMQDSVPCKIRAKRGMATHPRSIAERVRRTKISERMRKLQDLVPSMDKQTNTADMLDLAVDYIKDLQRQVKTLSENRANCTCTAKQQL